MTDLSRRQFLRNGLILGVGAAVGLPSMKAMGASDQVLTLYNGQHKHTTLALIDAFTKATGIKVEHRKGGSSELANQIIAEGERSPADVFYSEESPPVVALEEKGLLAKLPDAITSQVMPEYSSHDGRWIGVTARSRVTVYNPTMVKEADLPASVLDMATAAWKGRVGFVPTSGAFQQQIIAIKLLKGHDAALDWLKGLKKYGTIYGHNMAAMRAVEAGEIATALVNNYYWFIVAREKGPKNMVSRIHYSAPHDPGCLITVSAAGMLKTSKHQEAARAFLAFMVSQQGQQVIADTVAEYPLRPGIHSPFEKPPYNLRPMDAIDPPDVRPADMGDAADAIALRREAGLA